MAIMGRSGHARRRADSVEAAAAFSHWFNVTARSLKTAKGQGWSSLLADEMEAQLGETTDDAYLRRVARGERLPQLAKTHSLGEGLRAAGLDWCSGALAVLIHPHHRAAAFGILDVVNREMPGSGSERAVFDWYRAAERLAIRESTVGQPWMSPAQSQENQAGLDVTRTKLAELTKPLHPYFLRAWTAYNAAGIEHAYGMFGLLHLISTDVQAAAVSKRACSILLASMMEPEPASGGAR